MQEMLAEFHADPGCLVVLNHPFWDQPTIGADRHDEHLMRFMAAYRGWIHAVEINGLRGRRENQRAVDLSERYAIPLISGGDRHGREPNAALNLTPCLTGSSARLTRRPWKQWGFPVRARTDGQEDRPTQRLGRYTQAAVVPAGAPEVGNGHSLAPEARGGTADVLCIEIRTRPVASSQSIESYGPP